MGSKKPKWLIKQQRKKLTDARRTARAKNPGTKDLGVRHLGRHGHADHGACLRSRGLHDRRGADHRLGTGRAVRTLGLGRRDQGEDQGHQQQRRQSPQRRRRALADAGRDEVEQRDLEVDLEPDETSGGERELPGEAHVRRSVLVAPEAPPITGVVPVFVIPDASSPIVTEWSGFTVLVSAPPDTKTLLESRFLLGVPFSLEVCESSVTDTFVVAD